MWGAVEAGASRRISVAKLTRVHGLLKEPSVADAAGYKHRRSWTSGYLWRQIGGARDTRLTGRQA